MKGSSSKSRRGAAAGLIGGLRSFSANLTDRAVVDSVVGLFIIVALSILLLRDYQRPTIQQLPVGAVAASDIVAPANIKIEDTAETKRLREQAVASVLPVFDYNARITHDVRDSIERIFTTGQQAAGAADPEQVRRSIEEASGILLEPEQFDVLIRHRFDPELERLMAGHVESVMTTGVVDRKKHMLRFGPNGIKRRDAESGDDLPVADLTAIRDLITARAALRSDKLEWPADYNQAERKMIGEIAAAVVVPNLIYNDGETEADRTAAHDSISSVILSVDAGKTIVARGETVTPAKAALLAVAADHRPVGQRAIEFAGTVVIVMLMMLVLWQYLSRYQRRHMRVRRHFLLQTASLAIALGLTRVFFAMASAMSQWATQSPFNAPIGYQYLTPFAVGAVMVTILTDANAAFVFSAILAVFIGVLSGNVYLAAFTLMSSAGAIYHLHNCRDRSALVRAGVWIGGVNAATALALDLLGANGPHLALVLFDASCAFTGGVLATMIASLLLPPFEWLFEITTSFKLLELSNLNLPLLKRLAEQAPGTYHHSIMVGLLAEAGAEAVGADALFARVACYYHDIGKSVRPSYFVENQTYMDNRHDKLSPKMSSIVLANHVKQGMELARLHKLPPRIIAIIPEHHGTGLMKFFYYKARQAADDAASPALEHEFRYPGPKPQSKEAAIIMIADSVEAAARTVQDPTPTKLANMITTIITRIRDDGQFDESDITMGELSKVADSFVKVLMGIHHHRIAYPGYDFNRAAGAMLSPVAPANVSGGAAGSIAGGNRPQLREVRREVRGD